MLRALRLPLLLATASLVAACGQERTDWNGSSGGQTDSVAPSRPTGLVGTAMGSSGASLVWTAATDNVSVTSYVVNRNGAQIGNPGTTNYVDSGLAPATTYSYSVAAVDTAGNLSPNSASVNVTTAAAPPPTDTTAPTQPAGFSAVAASSSLVNLAWSASTDNVGVTGYIVTRNGIQIATPTATSFADSGRAAATSYTYTVAARDAAGNLSTAASASVTTPTAPPPDTTAPTQPAGLSAVAASSSLVNLAWSASTDNVGVTGYIVTRNGVQIATPTATSFADSGRTPATSYTYTVAARDAAGNLSTTASASVTTPAVVTRTVDLSWDAVIAPNVNGYRVYYGTASRNYIQPFGQGLSSSTTTLSVSGLVSGTRYFFAVTATDSLGDESGFSNEVFTDIP